MPVVTIKILVRISTEMAVFIDDLDCSVLKISSKAIHHYRLNPVTITGDMQRKMDRVWYLQLDVVVQRENLSCVCLGGRSSVRPLFFS